MNIIYIRTIFIKLFFCLFYSIVAISADIDFFSAILKNDRKSIEKLLTNIKHRQGIFNREGQTPLYYAAESGKKDIVILLLESGFSPDEAYEASARLSRQFALSVTNPSTIGFVNKESLSPRKRSISSISHFEAQKFNRTPIFSLLKDNPTKNDLEITKILLTYNARLDKINSEGKSPIDILVEKLFALSKTHQKIFRPNSDRHRRARDFFMRSLSEQDKLQQIIPHWHLFANSATTADLLDSLHSSKKSLVKNFLPLLVDWKLDSEVPSPEQALEIYQKSIKFLNDKQKFTMLMTYLYLWTQKTQFHHFQQKVINSIRPEALLEYKANRVAETIFYIDKKDYITLPPKTILMKYSQGEINPQLENFLSRTDTLRNFVALSIVTAKSKKKMLNFWRKVSIRLEKLGDFFGLQAVRAGLYSTSVTRLIATEDACSQTIDVSNFKQYSAAKIYRSESGFIPSIIIEGGQFQKYFQDASFEELFSDTMLSLDANTNRFLSEFKRAKNALKAAVDQEVNLDHNLLNFFTDLPLEKGSDELFSLSQRHEYSATKTLNKYFAENWDTTDFFWWWKTYEPGISINQLIELKIVDGPALIESLAFHKAYPKQKKSEALRNLFTKYKLYCMGKAAMPLGRPQNEIFEDRIMSYPQSSFRWIMWLRNQGLQREIPALLAKGIVNFETFIVRKQQKGVFSSFSMESVNILENLFQIYELSQKLPHPNEWVLKDLESWLFSKGFNHLTPLINKDIRKKLHRFLAFGYFLKHNPGGGDLLPNNNNWIYQVFEHFNQEYDIDALISSGSIKKSKKSYLFFITTLTKLAMERRLVNFYENKVHSVLELTKFLEHGTLEDLGLLQEEISALSHELDKMLVPR